MTSDQVMDLAGKYLAYKPRTRKELCDHLLKKGCSESQAAECADRMEEYHLIDDVEYSRAYIESRTASGRGMARIRAELSAKGVDRNTIEDALLLTGGLPDEYAMALEQARAAVSGLDVSAMDYAERQKVLGRIARRLAGRGFSPDTVYRASKKAIELSEQGEDGDGI